MSTLVLGLGNILCSDEGLGSYAVQILAKDPPPAVDVIDGGVCGMGIMPYLNGVDHLIIVDAIHAHEEAGSIFRFSLEDAKYSGPDSPRFSLHQIEFLEVLKTAELAGIKPKKVTIVGMEPASLAPAIGLSATASARLPKLIEVIRDEISLTTDH